MTTYTIHLAHQTGYKKLERTAYRNRAGAAADAALDMVDEAIRLGNRDDQQAARNRAEEATRELFSGRGATAELCCGYRLYLTVSIADPRKRSRCDF